jgi:hypothetical protein
VDLNHASTGNHNKTPPTERKVSPQPQPHPHANRKVLKLAVEPEELEAFVKVHKELNTPTLSSTLGALCRFYEQQTAQGRTP